MCAYATGWRQLHVEAAPEAFIPSAPLTVIIPARNEERNIAACLASVLNGTFPHKLLTIIVVDDFSEDETANIVAEFSKHELASDAVNIELLSLKNHLSAEHQSLPNKKRGITMAVARAQTPLIATTDADCVAPPDWLRQIAWQFESRPELSILTGPVLGHRESKMLHYFQSLDMLGLAGITGAGYALGWHRMGNAANLAYRKSAFMAAGGYTGNEQIASGDDMFLLHKMARTGAGRCAFLKSPAAALLTETQPDWRSFWRQRLRWGSKNAAMPEWPIRLVLLAVLLFCCALWLALIPVFTAAPGWKWVWLISWGMKALVDAAFLHMLAAYFGRKELMRYFIPSFFLHTAYVAFAGLGSLFFRSYSWKGRKVPV